jgi:hypothetical protein
MTLSKIEVHLLSSISGIVTIEPPWWMRLLGWAARTFFVARVPYFNGGVVWYDADSKRTVNDDVRAAIDLAVLKRMRDQAEAGRRN